MARNFLQKAATNKKYRVKNAVIIGIVGLLSVFGLVMMIYNFTRGNILFGISYLIAIILGFTYVFIKLNSLFSTYIAVDKRRVYMKNWTNDFLFYDVNNKNKLLREFIPAKTKTVEIPLTEITTVLLGTKGFIKKYAPSDSSFHKAIARFDRAKDYYQKSFLRTADIIYIGIANGECYYMPIVGFDSMELAKIIYCIQEQNPDADIKLNSREFKNLRNRKKAAR